MTPVLIVLGVVTLILTAYFMLRARLSRDWDRALKVLAELAPRLSLPAGVGDEPTLKFTRRGFPAAISVHVGTRLNFEISFRLTGEEEGGFTVSSLRIRRALLDQIGLRDLQVGDEAFDARFEVWGEDEDLVREKLSPPIRGLLNQLDMRWDFFMRLNQDQLSIRARVSPMDRFQAETLVGMAYQILDLLDLRSAADFVLSKVQEKLSDETRCPVCGAALSKGVIVRCRKCRAAHHGDCWKFNGLCATFACGSQAHV